MFGVCQTQEQAQFRFRPFQASSGAMVPRSGAGDPTEVPGTRVAPPCQCR